jgi:hypothetical protein
MAGGAGSLAKGRSTGIAMIDEDFVAHRLRNVWRLLS